MWRRKAQSLIAAFDVLATHDDRQVLENASERCAPSVPYMLAGFAIENLLKGELVARRRHVDLKGKFKLTTHDLRQLASDAGHAVSSEDDRLLERIQEFTVWAARYPVPLDSEAMRPRATPEGGFAPRTYGQLGADWDAIRALFVRFANAPLQSDPPAGVS